MSAGNDTVGEMWEETKIFEGFNTLDEVMRWAMDSNNPAVNHSRKKIIITRPHL